MVMILQFNREMDNSNKFFKTLYSSPSLLWKAGAGLIFFFLSIALVVNPSLTGGLTDNTRWMLGGVMMLYALFRFYSFYAEYKSYGDE
jgi:hypothetical protein